MEFFFFVGFKKNKETTKIKILSQLYMDNPVRRNVNPSKEDDVKFRHNKSR